MRTLLKKGHSRTWSEGTHCRRDAYQDPAARAWLDAGTAAPSGRIVAGTTCPPKSVSISQLRHGVNVCKSARKGSRRSGTSPRHLAGMGQRSRVVVEPCPARSARERLYHGGPHRPCRLQCRGSQVVTTLRLWRIRTSLRCTMTRTTHVPLWKRPIDSMYFTFFALHLIASLCVDST